MSDKKENPSSEWVVLEEEQVEDPKKARRQLKAAHRAQKRRENRARRLSRIVVALTAAVALYCVLVFSHIHFIEKWRTIYIETAMGTMNHQWLATMFLPQSVIDDVMNGRRTIEFQQEEYNSDWDTGDTFTSPEQAMDTWDAIKGQFFEVYAEIDQDSFENYMEQHKRSDVLDEDGYLLIDAADYNADETGITTIYGDPVCAIDTRNGIVIVALRGDGYCGRMAIVKNPAQVKLAVSNSLGSSGSYLKEICKQNAAALGINASGFADPEGAGNGGEAMGIILSDSVPHRTTMDETMKVIGMDTANRLNISNTLLSGTRDAMQFSPALVVNGEQLISGSSGWGLQPRSVIGQTASGQMLMAVVDGRQPGYSVGITLGDLTDILYQYGAYQACNLDGGSSSVMYYRGRNITRSSAVTPDKGRHIPNAWIVTEN
ncbi:MAG: phosphodiester glycosidase family protein [Eubacteriales bacterium]|nr:phosphodiester glycosidase family protein [Eubacteriales bacterium]